MLWPPILTDLVLTADENLSTQGVHNNSAKPPCAQHCFGQVAQRLLMELQRSPLHTPQAVMYRRSHLASYKCTLYHLSKHTVMMMVKDEHMTREWQLLFAPLSPRERKFRRFG